LFFLYIGRNILKCPVITLTLLIPGTLLQANELQQSYNTVLDATKDSVKKLADEWIKESSRATQHLQDFHKKNLDTFDEATNYYFEYQKHVVIPICNQLRIGFNLF
jgi:hypothetical protein